MVFQYSAGSEASSSMIFCGADAALSVLAEKFTGLGVGV